MNRLAPLVVLLGLTFASPALGQADALSLTDVQEAYDALDGLRASFTQVISSNFAGDTTQIRGTVLLSGNKYRVEAPDQTVVTDGQTTWIYTPADSQVVLNDAEQDESTVTPETFLTASADLYTVTTSSPTTRQGAPHVKLAISASDSASRFTEATLWVRRTDRVVTRMRATDRNGSILDLRLRDIVVNPDLGTDPFSFSPPENVEVIDLRRNQ